MKSFIQELALGFLSSKTVQNVVNSSIGRPAFCAAYWLYKDHVEVPGAEALKPLIPPGSWAIDVGANIGYFTTKFSRWVSGGGKVIAVEPEEVNFTELSRRLARKRLSEFVILRRAACTEKDGPVQLFVTPNHPGDHRLINADGIPVQGVTLDQLVSEVRNPHVGLIKIDTQGAEMAVLRGASKTISRCSPAILIEVDDVALRKFGTSASELLQDLEAWGYDFATLSRKGPVQSSRSALEKMLVMKKGAYLDVLCISQNA